MILYNELVTQNVDVCPFIPDGSPSKPDCVHFCLKSEDIKDGPGPAGYQWLNEDDEVDDIN